MTIQYSSALACPIDGLPLTRSGSSWQCPGAHSYDVARQGYINLLPVQNKRSKDPGDSKDMIIARQQFLAEGFYQPIADAVCKSVTTAISKHRGETAEHGLTGDRTGHSTTHAITVLDAGCGEGYYLRELRRIGLPLHLTGLDISKWAVIAAARQDKMADWLVASNANLPQLPATQEIVLCMFGFPVYSEFARVLTRDGVLIKVDAGADHLLELREVIYPSIKPASNAEELPKGFMLLEHRAVRYTISLNSQQQISNLLTMTPHLYRTTAAGRERAAALAAITLTIDVRITCMGKEESRRINI